MKFEINIEDIIDLSDKNKIDKIKANFLSLELMHTFIAIAKMKNISKAELALAVGQSQSMISQYRSGNRNLNIETISKMLNYLNLEIKIEPKSEHCKGVV